MLAPAVNSSSHQPLDVLVGALVLQALEHAALESSLQVAADVEAERHQVHQQWTVMVKGKRTLS